MKPVHKKVVGRMFSLQDSLPKLPVPALDATLQKYLKTVRPLVSDEDYKQTQQYVEEFRRDSNTTLCLTGNQNQVSSVRTETSRRVKGQKLT